MDRNHPQQHSRDLTFYIFEVQQKATLVLKKSDDKPPPPSTPHLYSCTITYLLLTCAGTLHVPFPYTYIDLHSLMTYIT